MQKLKRPLQGAISPSSFSIQISSVLFCCALCRKRYFKSIAVIKGLIKVRNATFTARLYVTVLETKGFRSHRERVASPSPADSVPPLAVRHQDLLLINGSLLLEMSISRLIGVFGSEPWS